LTGLEIDPGKIGKYGRALSTSRRQAVCSLLAYRRTGLAKSGLRNINRGIRDKSAPLELIENRILQRRPPFGEFRLAGRCICWLTNECWPRRGLAELWWSGIVRADHTSTKEQRKDETT